MRPTFWVCLTAICLLVATLRANSSGEKGKRAKAPKPAPVSEASGPSWTVEGYGKSFEDAKQVALGKAQDEVAKYLINRDPPIWWKPPVEYIDSKLVTDRENKEVDEQLDADVNVKNHVTLTVEVTSQMFEEMVVLDKHNRMERRQINLARLLAVLVTVLGAIAGYLRLDEATKGYYTNWLRLGSVGLVGAVAMGLWRLA